jgi:hypothetical protein
VRPPVEELSEEDTVLYYRVVLPKIARRVPLPSNSLTWSGIAYLLWDDIDPNLLTLDQQDALVDWLHFGGQLLVSGPNSLDKLHGSFLETYLPAKKTKSIELAQAAFDGFNDYWLKAHQERQQRRDVRQRFEYEPLTIVPETPPLGVELQLAPEARFFPGGSLVCERQVGRGRVVLTAFALDNRRVRSWSGFDEFLNCWLLRRPPREFKPGEYGGVRSAWSADFPTWEKDPRISTTLRYFTRDIGHMTSDGPNESDAIDETPVGEPLGSATPTSGFGAAGATVSLTQFSSGEEMNPEPSKPPQSSLDPNTDDPHFLGFRAAALGGAAGWNDNSGAADAARKSLREAAGISIPEAGFVLRALAVYLLVLVPVNWGFFRLIGRVEYAWAVAPVLAIAGAAAVIRFAQLDIGFARSHNEVAVLEVHGDYQRGHLTRYTALYTSLSTGYDMAFDDSTALVQPFAVDPAFERRENQSASEVRFAREKQISLRDFQVASNSTDMIHSEQMYNLGGPLSLEGDEAKGFRVRNDSTLSLRDVGVLRAGENGQFWFAWLDELKAKTAAPLEFQSLGGRRGDFRRVWKKSKVAGPKAPGVAADEVRLTRFFELAADRLRLRPGDVRLVGYTDEKLAGFNIKPAAAQHTTRTMVLVHLKSGELAPPIPDKLSKHDIIEKPPVLREDWPMGDDPMEDDDPMAEPMEGEPMAEPMSDDFTTTSP